MDTKTRLSILHQLLIALYQRGSWCGETHVQKAAYFLQHFSGQKLFPFVLYKFGPFSFELRDDLELMRAYGLVNRQFQSQAYGPRLIPANSENIVSETSQLSADFSPWINRVADELRDAGVAELEKLATALYFTKERDFFVEDSNKRVEKIRSIKPHISESDAQCAINRVEQMFTR